MIVGFQVNKIESKSFAGKEHTMQNKSINVNFEVNIKNPILIKQNTPFGKKQVMKLEYAMSINYLNPNIGYIRFEGSTDYYSDGDIEEIQKQWVSGSASTIVQNEIANTMINNLVPLALTMSKTMGLPSAVPLPVINFGEKIADIKMDEPTYYHG